MNPLAELRSWHDKGPASFFAWLAGVGAAAGLAAWLLALALHGVLQVAKPTALALVLAVPRGALFGVLLGFVLHVAWRRRPPS